MKKRNIYVIIVFLLFIIGITTTQALEEYGLLKSSTIGENCFQGFSNIIKTSDGNLVAVGQYSSKNFGLEHKGTSDAVIVKYDKEGNILWKTNYSTELIDFYTSVVEIDGYYYAAGYTTRDNSVFTTATNLLLVKYDSSGKQIWAKTYYVHGGDTIQALATDGKTITAVGYTSTGYAGTSYKGFIANFSLDGTQNAIKESTNSFMYTSVLYDGTNYVVGGAYSKNNDLATLNIYSSNLEQSKEKDLEFSGIVNKVIYSNNQYYVVGDTDTSSFVASYSKELNLVSKNTLSNNGELSLLNIIEIENGYYVTGYTNNAIFDSTTLKEVKGYDYLVAEYDKNLKMLSLVNLGTEKDDIAFSSLYETNKLYFAGYTSTEQSCDVNTLCPAGWTGDKYGAVTNAMNVSNSPGILANLSIYGVYNIYTKTEGKGTIKISNTTAKAGNGITFEVVPEEGYVLGVVKVTDANGNIVTFTDYTFTMPSADVTIEAFFVPENPDTGAFISYIALTILLIIFLSLYINKERKRKFYKI